ncbi:methylated-DNA--[protein]-cysteine S-methyltransferase [soil metagenome]
MNAYIDEISFPVGAIEFATIEAGALVEVWFREGRHSSTLEQKLNRQGYDISRDDRPTAAARQQLTGYFAGERQEFDLLLAANGSNIQRAVWKELAHIPFGETVTYGQLADAIGMPGQAQEVGAACAANPLPLVVPCHRVEASDGSLRGYSAGLHIKELLLAFEKGQRFLAA